jgi:hypothetical protein
MNSLMLIGGMLGFAFGITFSIVREEPVQACLWHGGVAAFFASLLLPWWGRALSKGDAADATPDRQDTPNSLLSTSTHPKASKS